MPQIHYRNKIHKICHDLTRIFFQIIICLDQKLFISLFHQAREILHKEVNKWAIHQLFYYNFLFYQEFCVNFVMIILKSQVKTYIAL
jgi:hypothetical protein